MGLAHPLRRLATAVALAIAVTEILGALSKTFRDFIPWPTISGTVGHLENSTQLRRSGSCRGATAKGWRHSEAASAWDRRGELGTGPAAGFATRRRAKQHRTP